MKFSCAKQELSEAIATCFHAASTKASEPVLQGLLIEADETVRLTAYNYKIGITKEITADITEKGMTVINARVLGDVVRKLPGDTVTFSVDDKPSASISCGVTRFELVAISARNYPELPHVRRDTGITLPDSLLKEMIVQTVFAVSENENKPTHTGSLFEVDNGTLTMCAVDGYRLSVRTEAVTSFNEDQFRYIVPGETLREVSRILPDDDEPCVIFTASRFALFEFGTITVTTRLLEGEFINYKAAIPQTQPISLKLKRQELISAIERVSIIVSEKLKNPVKCLFEGTTLRLNCITPQGSSSDELSIPECPETIEIGFNNNYILDALKASPDEEVLFQMKSGLSPCTIRPVEGNSYVYLVLPVRLKPGD